LKLIYNHSDGYTSATASTNFGVRELGKAASSAAPASGGNSVPEWGRAIHTDGLGRPDVFVRDFGRGEKMITHVFWTLEARRGDIQ
jgi:hypothetical protein